MKRTVALLAAVALLLAGLTACGITGKTQESASGAQETTQDTAVQPAEAAAEPTAAEETTAQSAEETTGTTADDGETATIRLTGSGAEVSSDKVSVSGANVVITGAGTYLISGTLTNGSLIVDADKTDAVTLVLDGVNVNAETYAALYVKQADEVTVTLADGTENTLSNGGGFTQQDENDVDAVIFSKDDLTFTGAGSLTVTSPAGHAVAGKDDVTFDGGVYTITSAECAVRANDSLTITGGTFTLTAGTDGIHAENSDDDTLGNVLITGGTFTVKADDDGVHANALLRIDGGTFEITAAEGLEATYVKITGGDISISASDDGINAAKKSTAYTPTVEITGGNLTIVMGAGDTDGVDSNGNIIISGGTVDVTGQSTFDYDGTATYTGGVIIVNGEQVSSIPNQMMGGMPGGMPGGGRGPRG